MAKKTRTTLCCCAFACLSLIVGIGTYEYHPIGYTAMQGVKNDLLRLPELWPIIHATVQDGVITNREYRSIEAEIQLLEDRERAANYQSCMDHVMRRCDAEIRWAKE